jgi:GTP-binding protein
MNNRNNRYHLARFIVGVHNLNQLPPDQGREVAFAGRSNAGKSSALNTLTQQKSLARTSKTPGRTQAINFFALDAECHLVDLPGYGYAKVPTPIRRHWQKTMRDYLGTRQALQGLFLLMDIRHPLTELDGSMLAWCNDLCLPCHVLLTKADKLGRGPAIATLQRLQQDLKNRYPLTSAQLFSALKRTGIAEAYAKLDQWLFFADPEISEPPR